LATVLHYDCGYSQRRCVKTMASGQKKVVIRRFAGALAWGYLPQNGLAHEDQVHLMAVDGRITPISFNEIKTIAYVHDFNLDDPVDAERIGRRSFAARPRGEGLWLRLTFQDADSIEGVAEVSLNLLDTLIADGGLFLTPPDGRSNTQRLFVPRAALRSLEVLGYITSPSKRAAGRASTRPASDSAQSDLFPEAVE
jgi:hypothetical protein